jgi:hypothetical protein
MLLLDINRAVNLQFESENKELLKEFNFYLQIHLINLIFHTKKEDKEAKCANLST